MSSPRLVFTDPSCPACKSVKKVLAPAIKAGKVKLVEEGSWKAKQILKQVKIRYVPECIVEKDGKFSKCNVEKLVADAKAGKL